MKLQSIKLYRVYITFNKEELIHKIVGKLEEKYNPRRITITKSKNVRDFVYLEIEVPRQGIEKEIEKMFKSNGITSVKVDVLEIKKPL